MIYHHTHSKAQPAKNNHEKFCECQVVGQRVNLTCDADYAQHDRKKFCEYQPWPSEADHLRMMGLDFFLHSSLGKELTLACQANISKIYRKRFVSHNPGKS